MPLQAFRNKVQSERPVQGAVVFFHAVKKNDHTLAPGNEITTLAIKLEELLRGREVQALFGIFEKTYSEGFGGYGEGGIASSTPGVTGGPVRAGGGYGGGGQRDRHGNTAGGNGIGGNIEGRNVTGTGGAGAGGVALAKDGRENAQGVDTQRVIYQDYSVNDNGVCGGPGIGGAAQSGAGGGGGKGGRGGAGGRGGNGGRASVRAEAYASVYTFMMCCIISPSEDISQTTSEISGYNAPINGAVPFAGSPIPIEDAYIPRPAATLLPERQRRTAPSTRQRERDVYIAQGGAGGGGTAYGGEGGKGGNGGAGGDGGQGGTGGRAYARVAASTPLYPMLMCCVFVDPSCSSPGD
ncbi:hypothetical protein E8E14_006316 [Neopestalotiopsis sp. 37M]|nr:hypothetical protein E8E14_006316 [Neopestalotiopsis sp. 37M]